MTNWFLQRNRVCEIATFLKEEIMKNNISKYLAIAANAIIVLEIVLLRMFDGNIFIVLVCSAIGIVLAAVAGKKNIDKERSVKVLSILGIVLNIMILIGAAFMLVFLGQLISRMR